MLNRYYFNSVIKKIDTILLIFIVIFIIINMYKWWRQNLAYKNKSNAYNWFKMIFF